MSNTSQTPKNKLIAIVLLAIVAVIIIFWQFRPGANPPEENATPNNVAQTTPTATPAFDPQAKVTVTLFLPNANALLTKTTVTEKTPFTQAPTWEKQAGHALNLLFKRLTDLPAGTKILGDPRRDKAGVVTVNVSQEFRGLEKHRSSETIIPLILDAMVKTVGVVNDPKGRPVPMQLRVEGKEIEVLGPVSLDGPWTSSQSEDEGPQSPKDAL